MADDAYNKLEKPITITRLRPNEYRLWVVQTEATFEVHKCLDIVLGREPNSTPVVEVVLAWQWYARDFVDQRLDEYLGEKTPIYTSQATIHALTRSSRNSQI